MALLMHNWYMLLIHSFIRSFIHYKPSNPQIRCFAADNLWQPFSLPCLGIPFTM